ncbi:MAG: conjugal transfer protein [Solirubrobacterales bacterium]
MSNKIGETATTVNSSSFHTLLRNISRAALWIAVALLLVRGAADVLSAPRANPRTAHATGRLDDASAAFAVRFARAYLADPSPRTLAPFLAEGTPLPTGSSPTIAGSGVTQAEVAGSRELGRGRAIVTVACEFRDPRTLYLAVPISRSKAGEVAALGAPSIVAAPAVAGVEASRPQPLAGSDAVAIEALVAKFLPAYLSASEDSDLSYLLAPGAAVTPLAGALELRGTRLAGQLGSSEGDRRTVIASAWVRDPESGAVYPLAYRLELVKRGRWYVSGVEGALP